MQCDYCKTLCFGALNFSFFACLSTSGNTVFLTEYWIFVARYFHQFDEVLSVTKQRHTKISGFTIFMQVTQFHDGQVTCIFAAQLTVPFSNQVAAVQQLLQVIVADLGVFHCLVAFRLLQQCQQLLRTYWQQVGLEAAFRRLELPCIHASRQR